MRVVGLAVVLAVGLCLAQPMGKLARVGILSFGSPSTSGGLAERSPGDFASAFSTMTKTKAGALVTLASSMFFAERSRIVDRAAQSRLPAIYHAKEYAEAGGLMTYGPDLHERWRRAATYVDKILKGTKPADLPIEQPTKFELVINLKTARALGLTIPPSVLGRADQIIE
jgi:putative ABC transport system substrate-binding protein